VASRGKGSEGTKGKDGFVNRRTEYSSTRVWSPVHSLLCLAILAGMMAFSTSIAGFGFEAVDDRGETVVLDQAPERLVVLGAFYAQVLVDLDLTSLVVGIGESPDNPPELAGVESVGPAYAPSVELILALSPDLVLGATDWNGDRAALEGAGISTYTAPVLMGIESIYEAVRSVGSLLGVPEKAEAAIARVEEAIATEQARVSGEPVSVAYLYAQPGGTLYAMGTGTPEDDLITLAGLVNAFADVQGYAQISIESLVAIDPAFLITDPTEIEIFEEHPVLSTLSALTAGHVVGVPARLTGSTQIDQALRIIVDAVYGE
jgi:iron complex transport system substrate-binding protein